MVGLLRRVPENEAACRLRARIRRPSRYPWHRNSRCSLRRTDSVSNFSGRSLLTGSKYLYHAGARTRAVIPGLGSVQIPRVVNRESVHIEGARPDEKDPFAAVRRVFRDETVIRDVDVARGVKSERGYCTGIDVQHDGAAAGLVHGDLAAARELVRRVDKAERIDRHGIYAPRSRDDAQRLGAVQGIDGQDRSASLAVAQVQIAFLVFRRRCRRGSAGWNDRSTPSEHRSQE